MAEVFAAVAPPHQRRQRDRQHHAGQQAAGEQRRDRDAGHRADGDQHQAGRDGFGLGAGGREQGDQIARLRAALFHFRKQHRCHRRHIGRFRARNARNQIHRADQHIVQAAADMAEQACQKRHHGARHAGHLDQQAKEHEQRHRQQDQVAHALVHAADQHHQRRVRRQCEVSEHGEPEAEGNGNAGKDAETGDADKEDDEVDVAERAKPWLRQPENRDQQHHRQHRTQHDPDVAAARQPQQRKQRHQAGADRQRGGAPDIGNLQRRRGDEALFVGVLAGRPRQQQQESQRRTGRDHIEIGP